MFACTAPALLGVAAVVVDVGFWMAGQAQLQIKADAAAMGAAYLLQQTGFLSLDALSQLLSVQAVAQVEAAGVSSRLSLSIGAPQVTWAGNTATVTLTSQMDSYFLNVFNIRPPVVSATATAMLQSSTPCVIQLGVGAATMLLDNSGSVSATLCNISINGSLTVNSGSATGTAINVAGSVSLVGGGNSVSPPAILGVGLAADPYAARIPPLAGLCGVHPDYTAYGSYVASPGTWCGSTRIGGNGSTISFNPGVYTVLGDLTFDNANVQSATGVTFVVTGNLAWTNNSSVAAPITAPASGATAGIAFWQTCGLGQTSSFQGGSSLLVAGAIYAPCSAADIGNNAQVAAPLTQSMSFIASSVHVHGSASLRAALRGGSPTANAPVLVR